MFGSTIRVVQWGLTWFIVLAISASLAYALTRAVTDSPSASNVPPTLSTARASQSVRLVVVSSVDTRCADPLGGGHPKDVRFPETTAPPAWCRQ